MAVMEMEDDMRSVPLFGGDRKMCCTMSCSASAFTQKCWNSPCAHTTVPLLLVWGKVLLFAKKQLHQRSR